jgi:hypothetical protein
MAYSSAMTTVLIEGRVADVPARGGDELWVPVEALDAATGWTLKPEGFCRGDQCIPIPPGREAEFVRGGDVSIGAFADYLGRPIIHDAAHDAWSIGESAGRRMADRDSLQAPDFTLPDLEGREHSLHDHLGRKIFLVSWASW